MSIDDGVLSTTRCGTVLSELLIQSCEKKITFDFVTGGTTSSLYKGVKLFYEGIYDKY